VRRPHLSRSEGRSRTLTQGRPWWGPGRVPRPPRSAPHAVHDAVRRAREYTEALDATRGRLVSMKIASVQVKRPPAVADRSGPRRTSMRFMRPVRAGGRPCRRCREPDQRPAVGRLQRAGTGPSPARRREAGAAVRYGTGPSLNAVHGVMVSAGRRLQGDDLPWLVGAAVVHWPCR
jgi:hypothetical protein